MNAIVTDRGSLSRFGLARFISVKGTSYLVTNRLTLNSPSVAVRTYSAFRESEAVPSSSTRAEAIASLVPSLLNDNDHIDPAYLGYCLIRFLALRSHIETTASPPPVAKVPCLLLAA